MLDNLSRLSIWVLERVDCAKQIVNWELIAEVVGEDR